MASGKEQIQTKETPKPIHIPNVYQEAFGQHINICIVLGHVGKAGHPAFYLFLQIPTIDDTDSGIGNALTQSS